MMKKTCIIVLIASLTATTGCSKPQRDLKSPCVGAKGSPCDFRPVNDWWMS